MPAMSDSEAGTGWSALAGIREAGQDSGPSGIPNGSAWPVWKMAKGRCTERQANYRATRPAGQQRALHRRGWSAGAHLFATYGAALDARVHAILKTQSVCGGAFIIADKARAGCKR